MKIIMQIGPDHEEKKQSSTHSPNQTDASVSTLFATISTKHPNKTNYC